MQRSVLTVVGLLVILSACSEPLTPADAGTRRSQPSSTIPNSFGVSETEWVWFSQSLQLSPADTSACQATIDAEASAMQVMKASLSSGGATCYVDGRRRLYFKDRGACAAGEFPGVENAASVTREVAELGLRGCLASAQHSQSSAASAVVFTASDYSDEEALEAFDVFAIDAYALAHHGGLQVSHMGYASGIICMETDQPEAVIAQVEASDVADGRHIFVETRAGSCQRAAREMTNQPWPYRP